MCLTLILSVVVHIGLGALLVAHMACPAPPPLPDCFEFELVEPGPTPPPAPAPRVKVAGREPRNVAQPRRRRRVRRARRLRRRPVPPRAASPLPARQPISDLSPSVLRRLQARVAWGILKRRARHRAFISRARGRRLAADRFIDRLMVTGAPAEGGGGKRLFGSQLSISGKRRRSSRLAINPRLLAMPRKRCTTRRFNLKPAIVKILVSRKGDVWPHRFIQRSGSRAFDRCARSYAGGLRFRPGLDASGAPLNTWLQIKVEPGTLVVLTRR